MPGNIYLPVKKVSLLTCPEDQLIRRMQRLLHLYENPPKVARVGKRGCQKIITTEEAQKLILDNLIDTADAVIERGIDIKKLPVDLQAFFIGYCDEMR